MLRFYTEKSEDVNEPKVFNLIRYLKRKFIDYYYFFEGARKRKLKLH